jgi:hypothetical protein
MSNPQFWSTPFRYLRWAAHERPAYLGAVILGLSGPVFLTTIPPIRRALGDVDPEPIPMTYPSMAPHFHVNKKGLMALRTNYLRDQQETNQCSQYV